MRGRWAQRNEPEWENTCNGWADKRSDTTMVEWIDSKREICVSVYKLCKYLKFIRLFDRSDDTRFAEIRLGGGLCFSVSYQGFLSPHTKTHSSLGFWENHKVTLWLNVTDAFLTPVAPFKHMKRDHWKVGERKGRKRLVIQIKHNEYMAKHMAFGIRHTSEQMYWRHERRCVGHGEKTVVFFSNVVSMMHLLAWDEDENAFNWIQWECPTKNHTMENESTKMLSELKSHIFFLLFSVCNNDDI